MIAIGFDTETAGLFGDMISLGASVDGVNVFEQTIKAPSPGSIGAIAVHGITQAQLDSAATLGQTLVAFEEWLPTDEPFYWVAHNAPYDVKIIEQTFCDLWGNGDTRSWDTLLRVFERPVVDTLRAAQKLLTAEEVKYVDGYKLDNLWLFHATETLGQTMDEAVQWMQENRAQHVAWRDAEMCRDLWVQTLKPRVPSHVGSLARLVEWLDEPMLIENWTFGKHKGTAIKDNPSFGKWLLKQPWAAADRKDDLYSTKLALGVE